MANTIGPRTVHPQLVARSADTTTVSAAERRKVQGMLDDTFGGSFPDLDATIWAKVKVASIQQVSANVFKVVGQVDYQRWNGGDEGKWTEPLRATVNLKEQSVSGNARTRLMD